MKKLCRTMLAAFALVGASVSFAACGTPLEYVDSSDAAGGVR